MDKIMKMDINKIKKSLKESVWNILNEDKTQAWTVYGLLLEINNDRNEDDLELMWLEEANYEYKEMKNQYFKIRRILEKWVEEDKLSKKTYKNQNFYWVKQEN